MRFDQAKLPVSAASVMRACPVGSVKPYALMLSPVYVFLRRNEKFVSVKAPLDFFVPEELSKFSPLETFFLPEFVDRSIIFRDSAARIRKILSWNPGVQTREGSYPQVDLPPAPFEISDAVLKITSALWTRSLTIEPFFITVFVNSLCELIPQSILIKAREKDIGLFERALFRSSVSTFFALHLGYIDLDFLNRMRLQTFQEVSDSRVTQMTGELQEINEWVNEIVSEETRTIDGTLFEKSSDRFTQKLWNRLNRIKSELARTQDLPLSIFGPGGLLNE